MTYRPPRWLESLAGTVVPPAAQESALGDLAECSGSTSRYLANLTSIVPRMIWSQIRRRATVGGVVFNAVLTAVVLSAAQASGQAPFFTEPWASARLAAPWAIWVAGCALAAAYGPRDKPTCWNTKLFAATIVAALGSAVLLDVPVARVAIGLAIVFAISLVLALPVLRRATRPPLSAATLSQHAHLFQKTIRWRNARESLACVFVVSVNAADAWRADSLMMRTGHLFLVFGVLFIMCYIHFRAGSRPVPQSDARVVLDFHRREIVRQRDILRAVPLWYLLPFAPGILVVAASRWDSKPGAVLLGLPVVAGIFALVWALNLWAARTLEQQLQQVDALDGGAL